MTNVLSEHKQQQVLALGRLGWSLRRIEAETGVRRETASAYLKAAGVAVRGAGGRPRVWPPPNPATTGEVSTDSAPRLPAEPVGGSACEPYRELIAAAVERGRNAMVIWQQLVDEHGFPAKYASVRRFVATLRGPTAVEARVVIRTEPGEEAQVDYGGDGPMVRDGPGGKYRRTRLFVMALGYSRKAVRLVVPRSSAQVWCELHERAFRRLGGTVRVVVQDNLKEGVLTPDIYDPALNPLYRDVLAHYGVVALPCRVGDPDRKGKVESSIAYTQQAVRGLRFETIEEAQAHLDRWSERWADTRIHGTTKRQVAAMFAEERPALGPLPVEPFRYYRFGTRTVHLDGCVEVDAAYYSAPPGWIGRQVQVQWNDVAVRLLDPKTGTLLREHLPAPRGWHRIADPDRPARTPRKTVALLAAAHSAGASIGALCDHIHQHDGAIAVRRILGVLALARKHGPAVVENAADTALELGIPTYRFLRRYLERQPPLALTLRQVDPLIRQLTLYRDLIERRTGDTP
ncbi:MAG: IS21 family transposase [Gemmatimonadaceae bacterium]